MVKELTGSYVPLGGPVGQLVRARIEYHPHGRDRDAVEIDFTPPWPRISMVEEPLESKGYYDCYY